MTEVSAETSPLAASAQYPIGYDQAIDALAGSPLNCLLLLQHAEADGPRTAGQQLLELEERCATQPFPSQEKLKNLIASGHKETLAPRGMVDVATMRNNLGKPAAGYALSDLGRQYGVPAAAAFLALELQFTSHLLKDFVGYSLAGPIRGRRAISVSIFDLLVDVPHASIEDLADHAGVHESNARNAVNMHERNNTVVKMMKADLDTRRLIIKDQSDGHSHRATSTVLVAIHNTATRLFAQDRREVTGQELTNEIATAHPEIGRKLIQKVLLKQKVDCIAFSDHADYGPNRQKKLRVELSESVRPMVTSLVLTSRALRTSLNFRAGARLYGKKILDTPELVSFLTDKANATEFAKTAAFWTGKKIGGIASYAPRDWRDLAACRDEDPELFFPVGTAGPSLEQAKLAKAVCRRCIVQYECLDWAVASGQAAGVMGGRTPEERRRLKIAPFKSPPKTNLALSRDLENAAIS